MNYLLPVINSNNNIELAKDEVENIITQQIIISQLAPGISFKDTNDMDNYERTFVFKKLVQIEKDKNDAKIKAIEDAKQKR